MYELLFLGKKIKLQKESKKGKGPFQTNIVVKINKISIWPLTPLLFFSIT